MLLSITALLAGAAYLPLLPSNAVVGRWWVVAAGAAVMLWGVRVRTGPAHWWLLGLLVWAALSAALWAVSGWDALEGLLGLCVAAMLFLVAAEATRDEVHAAWLAFAAGVSLSAPFAVAQWLGWHPVWEIHVGAGLFLSVFMSNEAAALALIGAVGLGCWWLAIGPAVVLLVAGGRTPALSIGVALLTALWLSASFRGRVYVSLVYAYGALLVLALWRGGHLGGWGFVADRWEIWTRYVSNVNPWGDGLGSAAIAVQGYEYAHNEFIQFAFELGIGSVALWAVVAHAMGARPILERVGLAALLAQCMVYFPLHAPAPVLVGALLAGGLCGERARERASRCPCGVARSSCLRHCDTDDGAAAPRSVDAGGADLAARPPRQMVAGDFRR